MRLRSSAHKHFACLRGCTKTGTHGGERTKASKLSRSPTGNCARNSLRTNRHARALLVGIRNAFCSGMSTLANGIARFEAPHYEATAAELENKYSRAVLLRNSSEFPALLEGEAARVSERELVASAQQGNAEAFGELVQRHLPVCMKRALRVLRDRNDAEDQVQNACWKAFRAVDQYRFDGTFAAWLCRIVHNECLMRIREERQTRFVHLDASTESKGRVELVDQMLGPEDEFGRGQVRNLLHAEIARIPALMRNAVRLRDVEGLSIPEVAARLGLSVPATKSRLLRARKEMRSRLAKYCGQRGQGTLTARATYERAEFNYVS